MSNPAYLWLTDTNGSPITGSSLVTGRIGAIELKAVTHHLSIPVDGNTGRLTGTRVHTPITVQKDFDKTTPLLYKALSENQTLKSATIKMYQILGNDSNLLIVFYVQIMPDDFVMQLHRF